MSEWILLGIGLLLTIGTGFFVASEFALVNLDRAELEARRARGETRLGLTISALKITSTHLSSAQLGITLTTLLTGYTMEPAISSLLAGPLTAIGLTEGAVRRRVQRLTDTGAIQVVAVTDPVALGDRRVALIGLRISTGTDTAAAWVGELAEVEYLVATAGRFDLMFAGIVTFAVLGFLSDRGLMAIRRRVLRGQMIGTAEQIVR